MPKEAAVAFLKQVAESPDLQKKLVAFAKQEGYEFAVDELTDSELGNVTGGPEHVSEARERVAGRHQGRQPDPEHEPAELRPQHEPQAPVPMSGARGG